MKQMKTIKLTYPHQQSLSEIPETIAAIGFFDGIHKGHQAVISEAVKKAKAQQKLSAVISFHPHPSVILKNPTEQVRYITTIEEKEKLLQQMGVDLLYIITFNKELSQLSPRDFIEHFIVGLHITDLVAGFDYTFGHRGAGNMRNIDALSNGQFTTTVIEKLEKEQEKISSTYIRALLADGKVDEVESLLGRVYTTVGEVVKGDNRGGSQLGFPTANLEINADKLLPKQGVYAVKIYHENNIYHGMANLGVVPTFVSGRTEAKVEVYIFDFAQDIYGESLLIEWHQYIREEIKFDSVEAIVQQLKADEQTIRKYFA